ncbi:hypothetical protein D3C75_1114530 [compost metagenome]
MRGGDPVHLPLPQRLIKRRADTTVPRQRQIQLSFQHPLDQFSITGNTRFDTHARMRSGKTAQDLWQKGFTEVLL